MTTPREALAAVEALEAILRKEIEAVEAGDFAVLVNYESEKARLGAALEQELARNPQAVGPERLRNLKGLILRDAQHLEQARSATAEIIAEVRHIRGRHGMAGVYGRSGAKRDISATDNVAVDKTI